MSVYRIEEYSILARDWYAIGTANSKQSAEIEVKNLIKRNGNYYRFTEQMGKKSEEPSHPCADSMMMGD